MNALSIARALGATSYPGRGILIGKTPHAAQAFLAYFIMGRSLNSRNRVFVEDGDGLRTQAFDPSAMRDPSLIIYAPVRVLQKRVIVTNGDQTDTVFDALRQGGSFVQALRTRTFEPDAPNFTPRISALVELGKEDFSLAMSVIKACDETGAAACRCFYEYESVPAGLAYFIHTYRGDGNPLPSFEGEPERVLLDASDIDALTGQIWQALDRQNRVSLWTRTIDLGTGAVQSRIVNANA